MRELALEKPVVFRGRFIRRLRMRAPTQTDVDQVCAATETAGERGLLLLAVLCNVSPRVVWKLQPGDKERLQSYYEELSAGLPCCAG